MAPENDQTCASVRVVAQALFCSALTISTCLQEEFLRLGAGALPRTGCGRGSKPAAVCEQTLFAFGSGHRDFCGA